MFKTFLEKINLIPVYPQPSNKQRVKSKYFRLKGGVLVQCFVPVANEGREKRTDRAYIRPFVTKRLAAYANQSEKIFLGVKQSRSPVAELLNPEEILGNPKVILFSHGLGGNCQIYTKTCMDLASLGYIVYAFEHEDGSGSYAETEEGTPILYTKPNFYIRANHRGDITKFRTPHLNKRIEEVYHFLEYMENPEKKHSDPLVNQIIDRSSKDEIILSGHSFGAATVCHFLHRHNKRFDISKAILFDIWSHPLHPDLVDEGVPVPVISVQSEEFQVNEFSEITKDLLKNSKKHLHSALYLGKSQHSSFSDVPFWKTYSPTGVAYAKKFNDILMEITHAFLMGKQVGPEVDLVEKVNLGRTKL